MFTLEIKANKEAEFVSKFCLPISLNSKFALGLEDDIAFLDGKKSSKILIKTDSVCEGIHYKIGTNPAKVGHKLLARNLSDIAAKGGSPTAFTLSVLKSTKTDKAFLEAFLEGIKVLAGNFSLPLIGGDITSTKSNFFSANITIFAEKFGKISERKNAKDGDFIYITGEIGRAFLGFKGEEKFLSFYETPIPQVILMKKIFEKHKIHASIDVSDGFLKDLTTLLCASKKGAFIDCKKIPVPKSSYALEELLTFGDDYQIIFTSNEEIIARDITKIGFITKEKTLKLEGLSNIPKNLGYENL